MHGHIFHSGKNQLLITRTCRTITQPIKNASLRGCVFYDRTYRLNTSDELAPNDA